MLANSSRAYKYHHGKTKLLFPAVQYQNTLFTSIYIYIYIYIFFFFHGHGSDRMFLQLNFHWNPFIAGYRSLASVAVLSINILAMIEVFSFDAIVY